VSTSAFAALAVIARGVAYAGIVGSSGAVVFHWGVLCRWKAEVQPAPIVQWGRTVALSGALASALVALASPARLLAQAHALVAAGDPVVPMMIKVLHTTWGRGWTVQTAAAVVLLIALLVESRAERAGLWLASFAGACATLSPALMGHAIAADRFQTVSVAADWLHVTAAAAWIGSLAMLSQVVAFANGDDLAAGERAARLVELFHPVALVSSAVLVGTGVVSLLLRVDDFGELPHSRYGAILGMKLGLTLFVGTLGMRHWRRGAAMATTGNRGALARSLATELAVAAFVIAVTAVLVGTSPPMRMTM
jgi:copper transport protein